MKWVILVAGLMLCAGLIFVTDVNSAEETVLNEYPSSQDEWDALFYRINLNLDFDNSEIDGWVYLRGKSLINGLSFIDLDLTSYFGDPLHYLLVDSVKVSGISNPSHLQMPNYVRVYFQPYTYDYGDTFKVTTYYHGKPEYRPILQEGFDFGSHDGVGIAFNMSEPIYARDWWPCKDRVEDKVESAEITITCPIEYRCASNGRIYMEWVSQTKRKTYWRESYPIATYQVGIGCTNYVILDTSYVLQSGNDTMDVWFYVYPENVTAARDSFPKVVEMLDTFATYFGEYPYAGIYPPYVMEKYGMMQVPTLSTAMEYPTITAICDTGYNQMYLSHELAHSWWGNCVTCSTWNHIWINEGFATYSECMWIEKKYGLDAMLEYIISQYRYLGNGSVYMENGYEHFSTNYWHRVFWKGSWVLHMLRHWVGDPTFYDILHQYLDTYKWKHASTEQFRDVCVNVTGDTLLNTFFHEWIYSDYHPVYEYWFYVEEDGRVYFNVKQTQTPSSDPWIPELYHMPIDIILDDGTTKDTVTVFNDQREQDYIFETSLTMPITEASICLDWLLAETTQVEWQCHFIPDPLRDGVIGVQYEDTVVFVCPSAASLTVWEGQLPGGLSLENTTGIISGTPTEIGTFPFTVRAALSEQGPFYYDYDTIYVVECRKWVVKPDHTGDASTIQAAIDSASYCDTVLLMDGTFWGNGNRDITFRGKPIIVRSQNGADACTLDCWRSQVVEDPPVTSHRGFYFHTNEGPGSVLEGVTIMNGKVWNLVQGYNKGGGLFFNHSSPTILNCKIIGNLAAEGGGGVCCDSASPMIMGCTINGNKADNDGGGIYCCNYSAPAINSCTISGNRALRGGGISHVQSSTQFHPILYRTIVWDNCADGGTGDEWYWQGVLEFCCSDVDTSGVDGGMLHVTCHAGSPNIWADPMFCDPEPCENAPTIAGNYYLYGFSPCRPGNPSGCGLIGALGILAGDCNDDGKIDVSDVVCLINFLFVSGSPAPMKPVDVNGDGKVNVNDVVYLINYLFVPGSPPPCCYCPE